jgi:hypothetical protein
MFRFTIRELLLLTAGGNGGMRSVCHCLWQCEGDTRPPSRTSRKRHLTRRGPDETGAISTVSRPAVGLPPAKSNPKAG